MATLPQPGVRTMVSALEVLILIPATPLSTVSWSSARWRSLPDEARRTPASAKSSNKLPRAAKQKTFSACLCLHLLSIKRTQSHLLPATHRLRQRDIFKNPRVLQRHLQITVGIRMWAFTIWMCLHINALESSQQQQKGPAVQKESWHFSENTQLNTWPFEIMCCGENKGHRWNRQKKINQYSKIP